MENVTSKGLPDVPYEQRLIHVPCPLSSGNIQEMIDRKNAAQKVFEYLCPPGAKIHYGPEQHPDVNMREGMKAKLFQQIRVAHPQNTKIMSERYVCVPPSLALEYTVIGCTCSNTPRPRSSRNKPKDVDNSAPNVEALNLKSES